eukprot:1613639-Pyramimonas_sp.AAC.1
MDMLDALLEDTIVEIKKLGRVGPGATGGSRGRLLKRRIEWGVTPSPRMVRRADDSRVGSPLKLLDLPADTTKPQTSPGSKATESSVPKEAVADERLRRLVPEAGGALTYLSQDVPKVQYAANMIMAEGPKPTPLAEVRLKRAARYLAGCPVTEWHCPLHGLPVTAD